MKIAVVKERRAHEQRVAASPDTVKKLVEMGFDVAVEAGAGDRASMSDAAYKQAGATIAKGKAAVQDADIVLKVQRPEIEELADYKQGAVLVGILAPYTDPELLDAYAKKNIQAFAMELMPRITRAQSMDVLSSQSNLAGYKAVLDATAVFGRAMPMMMTAAGTIPPARVVVMGAGVAGLQAIATARRLGAIVSAFDVRAAAKEQVESLGASFIEVDPGTNAETAGGYAKEMDDDYKKRQAAKIAEVLAKSDIVICTALIPGKAAPVLVTSDMVAGMKPGSVIVDLAVEQGGNCEASEAGKVVTTKNDVQIVGHYNVPSRLAEDASRLYAKNLLNFITLLYNKQDKTLNIDPQDEIIKGTRLTDAGTVIHPNFAKKAA